MGHQYLWCHVNHWEELTYLPHWSGMLTPIYLQDDSETKCSLWRNLADTWWSNGVWVLRHRQPFDATLLTLKSDETSFGCGHNPLFKKKCFQLVISHLSRNKLVISKINSSHWKTLIKFHMTYQNISGEYQISGIQGGWLYIWHKFGGVRTPYSVQP